MDFDVTREQWIERFSIRLALDIDGMTPEATLKIAEEAWEAKGHLPPEDVADAVAGEQRLRPPPAT